MTQSQPNAGDPGRVPAPTFFDPSFERLPAPVAGETATPGPVLLLFDRAADRQWAADAAVTLATGWHAAGHRTVLADLCLEDPFLSERIGMPNQEGVVDIFLYGASLARSARPVPGRGFHLISAGTYTPDAGAVLRNPRWDKIVAGFRDNRAALLLFVPSDAPELPALRRFVSEAILLGGSGGRSPLPPELAEHFSVRAWLAPPRRDEAPPAAARPASPADRFPDPEPAPMWAQPGLAAVPSAGDDLRQATESAQAAHPHTPGHTPAPAATPTSAIPVPEPGWKEAEEPKAKKRRVSPVLLILLFLFVLLAAYVFAGPMVGLPAIRFLSTLAPADPAPAPKQGAAPAQRGPVTAAGEVLPYSVHVAGFQRWEDASAFAARQARRFTEAQFFIVPEDRQGVAYWTVMAGMAGDTTAVLALRDRLIAEKVADEQSVGGRYDLIQHRPLAYELGDYPTREQARARADSLTGRAISAYVAPVPYSDGSERWKVYAGAYRDSASAAPLQKILAGANIQPRLVERAGRPPASPK